MKLSAGDPAPLFNLVDVFERPVDLSQNTGKKTLVAFFRNVACPFCNLRVYELLKASERLKKEGLEMIFFFESKKRVILRSSFHQEIAPIPLLSDPEREWYKKYGTERSPLGMVKTIFNSEASKAKRRAVGMGLPDSGDTKGTTGNLMPAEFLLGPDLKVEYVHYAKHLNDRIPLKQLEQYAASGLKA
ncbi:redoxin domain-containing protein [Fulvitalea axinellae]